MGRNPRKRPVAHENQPAQTRCPRCGSTNVFIGRTRAFQRGYLDMICGNCNWQGEIPIQGW